MPYLTPNTSPTDTTCRALFIPNDPEFLAIVRGALEELTFSYNFDEFGALTPAQTAAAFAPMFDAFCFDKGSCLLIGQIVPYGGSVSPDARYLVCDGSSILRTDYPDLFNVIGTTYGNVDGSHFNVPDLSGRVPLGAGSGFGLTTRANGQTFGEETHVITGSESASHTHIDSGHTHSEGNSLPAVGAAITGVPVPSAVPSVGITGLGAAAISSSGGDGAHNNIQPSLVITYLIVALS